MTSTITTEPGTPAGAPPQPAGKRPAGPLRALISRLHFYAGVFVGPFLLIAALSGALYALTPAMEETIYDKELHVPVSQTSVPLAEQIRAAQQVVGDQQPSAVRPAPMPGDTTRVMFADPSLGESESRAIFINPANAEVRGDLTVYGTSGVLPFRTWIDQLHRNLHLGDLGRIYSELAASWLWVIALAGLVLWLTKPRRQKPARKAATGPVTAARKGKFSRARLAKIHGTGGAVLILGFLFLSATGLTWSQFAGDNISNVRSSLDWTTPKLPTALSPAAATPPAGEHDHGQSHGGSTATATDPTVYDHVLAAARQDPLINAGRVEIKPPAKAGTAWTVTEIDRSWPTQADAVAVDPTTMSISGKLVFEDFSLAAKLTRWGIDGHMGVLFGLANQLVLVIVALGLATSVLGGYLMWWKRRPTKGPSWAAGRHPGRTFLRTAPWPLTAGVAIAAIGVGIAVPLLGISLLAFMVFDVILGVVKNRRRSSTTQ
ncbi:MULTISPECIES: PepSY-associated TM helix domain-containing protein [unclassified Arthrobacter]|uniref:PepSY-associated TM helix domain-containing protein n=1 Tax=unclassified Arthrobacter TaxID=235627 RepID=UPI0028834BF0|nr:MULTISPECIES: PepSY-associated TM helix domain-containing protein [unclassified Arthrobacter]